MRRIAIILGMSLLAATTAHAQQQPPEPLPPPQPQQQPPPPQQQQQQQQQQRPAGDRAADEKAIRNLEQQFEQAWNKGDVAAMANIYAEDADHVEPWGGKGEGRSEIRQMFERNLGNQFKGTTFQSTCGDIRFITPDVAEVDCKWTVEGITAKGMPSTMSGMYTVVAERTDGEWKVAASRAMVPAPMGAPPAQKPGQE